MLHGQHEGEIHPSLGKIVRLKAGLWETDLRKEVVCPQGGSCMDLVATRKLGEWGNLKLSLIHQVHIALGHPDKLVAEAFGREIQLNPEHPYAAKHLAALNPAQYFD